MEYMEGGALTDVIENNTLEEDQISSISLEVSWIAYYHLQMVFGSERRGFAFRRCELDIGFDGGAAGSGDGVCG